MSKTIIVSTAIWKPDVITSISQIKGNRIVSSIDNPSIARVQHTMYKKNRLSLLRLVSSVFKVVDSVHLIDVAILGDDLMTFDGHIFVSNDFFKASPEIWVWVVEHVETWELSPVLD